MLDPKLLATLRSFRGELYDTLGLRQDSLFELMDAVLTPQSGGRWFDSVCARVSVAVGRVPVTRWPTAAST